jgi:serine/threonine protein kinase
MVYGKLPFPSRDMIELKEQIVDAEYNNNNIYLSPCFEKNNYDDSVVDLLRKLLDKDPKRRIKMQDILVACYF